MIESLRKLKFTFNLIYYLTNKYAIDNLKIKKEKQ